LIEEKAPTLQQQEYFLQPPIPLTSHPTSWVGLGAVLEQVLLQAQPERVLPRASPPL